MLTVLVVPGRRNSVSAAPLSVFWYLTLKCAAYSILLITLAVASPTVGIIHESASHAKNESTSIVST